MKKLGLLVLMVVFLFGLSTQSFALLKVEGIYSVYAKNQGVGAGLELPIIPFIPTFLYVSKLNDKDITLGSFTYSGKTFAATPIKFNSLAAELQIKTPIDLFGIKVGATVMADMLTAKDSAGKTVALPGNVYGGFFGQYNQDLLPFIGLYAQVGYLSKLVDGEKALNTEVHKTAPATTISLKDIDESGLYYRAGVSIGF